MDDENSAEEDLASRIEDAGTSHRIDSCLAYSADGQLLIGQSLQNFRKGSADSNSKSKGIRHRRASLTSAVLNLAGSNLTGPELKRKSSNPAV